MIITSSLRMASPAITITYIENTNVAKKALMKGESKPMSSDGTFSSMSPNCGIISANAAVMSAGRDPT